MDGDSAGPRISKQFEILMKIVSNCRERKETQSPKENLPSGGTKKLLFNGKHYLADVARSGLHVGNTTYPPPFWARFRGVAVMERPIQL